VRHRPEMPPGDAPPVHTHDGDEISSAGPVWSVGADDLIVQRFAGGDTAGMTGSDPDPATTPGLEPGGGVAPGDTPPGEASTAGPSQEQPIPGRALPVTVFVVLGVIVLLIAVGVIGRIAGLFG